MSAEREAQLTLPQALRRALGGSTAKSLDELSRELGVSEKALPDALDKLRRSLQRTSTRLCEQPPRCLACGFELEARGKRPSRCPRCKSERLSRSRFKIE